MAKYVLAADYTLMTDYRNVPLATFFSCIPTDYWHSRLVFRILADPPKLHPEVDHLVPGIFDRIVNDHAPPVMRFTNATAPTVDQIPKILGPTMHAMNEVMRGCGRGCEFCEVTLRRPRYFPFDYIGDEIAMNTKVGESSIQLHSDDIFLYNLENWKTMEPNEDAVKDLFRYVMAQPGVSHCYPTHGTVSAAVTNPGLIRDISDIVRAGPGKWVGIQSGIETGSPALSRAVLHRKAAPFTAEEWPDLVVQGTQILNRNYWYPAFTIILGLPGETPEDAWMTVDLLDRMEQIPDGHFITAPLTFVPIGVLRGEEFYNLDEMIDESRFNVAYRAWRHVLLEIDTDLWRLTRLPAPTRALVVATGRIGGRYILALGRRFARQRGFRVRAPATTRRKAEGHTVTFPAA